jgi:hypothetical protein
VGDPLLGGRREPRIDATHRLRGAEVLNRHDFGVSWQDEIPGGGVVVSNEIALNLDLEAINDDDLRRVGEQAAIYEPRELPTEARASSPDAGA